MMTEFSWSKRPVPSGAVYLLPVHRYSPSRELIVAVRRGLSERPMKLAPATSAAAVAEAEVSREHVSRLAC